MKNFLRIKKVLLRNINQNSKLDLIYSLESFLGEEGENFFRKVGQWKYLKTARGYWKGLCQK